MTAADKRRGVLQDAVICIAVPVLVQGLVACILWSHKHGCSPLDAEANIPLRSIQISMLLLAQLKYIAANTGNSIRLHSSIKIDPTIIPSLA